MFNTLLKQPPSTRLSTLHTPIPNLPSISTVCSFTKPFPTIIHPIYIKIGPFPLIVDTKDTMAQWSQDRLPLHNSTQLAPESPPFDPSQCPFPFRNHYRGRQTASQLLTTRDVGYPDNHAGCFRTLLLDERSHSCDDFHRCSPWGCSNR